MIEIKELESTKDPDFQDAVRIYEAAYPQEQRVSPDYFIHSMQHSLSDTPDPGVQRHFLVSRRDGEVNGMATFTYHPQARFGFLRCLAVNATRPDQVAEDALYQQVLNLVQDSDERGALGCVVEMDRPELTVDPGEKQRRETAIERMKAQQWVLLDSVDYHMPPLHEGEDPTPMWLLFYPLGKNTLDDATIFRVVRAVYRDVYGLEETDQMVKQALKRVQRTSVP